MKCTEMKYKKDSLSKVTNHMREQGGSLGSLQQMPVTLACLIHLNLERLLAPHDSTCKALGLFLHEDFPSGSVAVHVMIFYLLFDLKHADNK